VWLLDERRQKCAIHTALYLAFFEHLDIIQNYYTINQRNGHISTAHYQFMSSHASYNWQPAANSYFHPLQKNNPPSQLKAKTTEKRQMCKATHLFLQGMLTCHLTVHMCWSHALSLQVGQHWKGRQQLTAESTDRSSAGFWQCLTSQCQHSKVGVGCRQTEKCQELHERWLHRHGSWSMQEHGWLTCWRRKSAADPAADTETEFLSHPAVTTNDQQLYENDDC